VKKVLVTGFNPFGGEPVNPALEAVMKLKEIKTQDYEVEVREIPTVFNKALDHLYAAIVEIKPDFVICVGQAGGRSEISMERVAININDARIADNEGNQPIDTPVFSDGPVAYWSTLPIKAAVKEMQEQGIPASVSHTAGTFVCNHLFYGLMHHISQSNLSIRGGFIHIPLLPEQVVRHPGQPSMSLETIVKGLKIVVETAAKYNQDIIAAGGQIN
jgi:pyroglutamyl-peptidase